MTKKYSEEFEREYEEQQREWARKWEREDRVRRIVGEDGCIGRLCEFLFIIASIMVSLLGIYVIVYILYLFRQLF